ncbi:hypothetical protein [Bacillus haynesii]|uniref:hypothetical protein n=1 Tax=Bacillus haynesii TaxID=1925021 RepID=UPI00228194C3|nr:hypothetical protein [Bacillus haynesii]MCY8550057.1 hypothetical protein [Bacillus haynesii]MCY8611962.1 hypothetical protein [Bacillus haynesii]MCY9182964.1 hypothetical protein [Bacillus haynesii]
MKSATKIIIGVVVGLLLVVGTVAFLNGWITVSRDTHPPCDQLPNVTEANAALARHQDLVEEIKALGDDITVEVGKPCPDDQNRGLVKVSYGSRSEHDAISDLLSRRDGFGVPVHLVKR